MKEFQYIINNYLLNREKHKKYLAFVLALSMLVSFAVPYSLIQSAESLTIDNSHLADHLAGATDAAPATGVNGYFESTQDTIPENSDDFNGGITGITIIQNGTVIQPDANGAYNLTAGSAEYIDVTLALNFTMPTSSISATDPCIHMQLPEGMTVPNEYYGTTSFLRDAKFTAAMKALHGESYDIPPAYYSINEEGLIVIQMTQDYVAYIKSGTTYDGTLNFNGRITRDDTATGDQSFNLGNITINTEFSDTSYDVRKTASVVNNHDGTATITWTVTVESFGNGWQSTLNGITLSDDHFPSDTSKITVDPSDAGYFQNGNYVFGVQYGGNFWGYDTSKATLTYTQEISESELNTIYSTTLKESNTASIYSNNFGQQQEQDSVTTDATFENTTVYKTGTPDYMTGPMNKQVNWSIIVENPYGANLSSYVISDQMLASAVSGTITVMDASGSNVPYTISGSTITLGTTDASKVIVTYKTPAEIGQTYSNTVKVTYPNSSNTLPEYQKSVTYENPYTLEKTGYSFDPENKKVYWDVTVKTKSDNVTLNGLVVTEKDPSFANLTMNDVQVVSVRSGSNSSITATNTETSITLGDYGTLTKNGSDITIADGTAGGLNEIKLRFATTVTDAQISGQETVYNTVTDSSGNEAPADKKLTTTYSLNKTGSYDASTQKVTWTITVKNSASNTATLNGMVLTDAAFADLFSKNFVLSHAYQPSYTNIGGTVSGNTVTFGNGSTMTLSGTTLTFANVNGEGVNEVKFTYQTDVSDDDIKNAVNQTNEVTANKPVTDTNAGKASVQVNNPYQLDKSGTFDASTGEVTWTVTVKNTAGNNASLGGIVLTDDAFANIDATKIKITTANYNYNAANYTVSGNTITFTDGGTATFDGNTLTFSDDVKVGELVFQYTTAVSSDDFEKLTPQTNTIKDNYGHEKPVTVTVTNPYSLSKTGQFNPATGTITWTVNVSGSLEDALASLNGYVLTDNAFKNLVNGINVTSAAYKSDRWNSDNLSVISNTGNVVTVGKVESWSQTNIPYATITVNPDDGTVTVATVEHGYSNYKNGIHTLTFTYETKVEPDDIVAETPQSNGIGDNKGHYTSVSVTPSNPFELTKDGVYDAENESVIWTIQSKNAGAGTLNGVVLTDAAFAKLTSISQITVTSAGLDGNYNFTVAADATDSNKLNISIGGTVYGSLTLADGKITITDAEGYGLDDVKFQFSTALTDEEKAAGSASNTVTDNKGQGDGADVQLTNPYTLGKGGSYSAEDGLITWNINAGITSSISTASIDGTVLTDEAIKRLTDITGIKLTTARYNNTYLQIINTDTENNVITLGSGSTAYATMTFDLTAGTVTFADATTDGTTGLTYIDFTYQTEPTAAERTAGSATNTVKNEKTDQTDDATVTITTRSTLGKYFENSVSSETIYGNDDVTARELSWRLDLLEDGGYADKGFLVDNLSSTDGSHYITQTQAAAITITAGQKSSDNYSTTLTAGTGYTITFYDASGNSFTIDTWPENTNAVKFEIDFAESVDTAKLRYVRVTYKTTADISTVIVPEGSESGVSASYGNTVTFGSNTDTEDGFDFTRYPSEYVEKVSIKVSKNWSDSSGSSQEGVQVQLYQKLNDGTSDWVAYEEPVTLTNDGGWTYTWENLPKTNTTRTTEYLYMVEEIEVPGYDTTYSNNYGINSGEIGITNSPVPYADKVYVASDGDKTSGTEMLLSGLTKETIDGTEYYIMKWRITPNPKGGIVVDTLPEDWTLLEDANSTIGKYGPFAGNSIYYEPSIVGWDNTVTYTNNGSTVTFNFYNGNYAYILYYTKIPVATLEQKIKDADGSYVVSNKALLEGGEERVTNITVSDSGSDVEETTEDVTGATTPQESGLLTKSADDDENEPGLMKFEILLNPEGMNLANGDTIDVADIFNLNSYVSTWVPDGLTAEQIAALNASLRSIAVYNVTGVTYDENGNPEVTTGTALNNSQYQYTVDYKVPEVSTVEYEFEFTKDASNHEHWVTSSCKPGEEVTLVVRTDNQYVTYVYDSAWNGITISSSSYDSTTKELTLKFTVPSGITSLIINSQDGTAGTVRATTTRTETPTAKLNISVPDETPLLIKYEYLMTGYEFLPGDLGTIGATNEASFDTGNAQGWDTADKTEFVVDTSGGTLSGNSPPTIKKSDTNDYTVELDAKFKLAYYDSTTQNWVFAVGDDITTESQTGGGVITKHMPLWSTADGTTAVSNSSVIPDGAHTFEIGDMIISLASQEEDKGKLYKIVEVDVPATYEGSNIIDGFNLLLKSYLAGTYTGEYTAYLEKFTQRYTSVTGDGENAATFEQLLQMYYLKSTDGVNGPYDNFFDIFQSEFYFIYGSGSYDTPDNFTETVLTVPISGTLSLTNSILMDVSATKAWDSTFTDNNATVVLELYYSFTKSSNGFPSGLEEATAEKLGLITEFSNSREITAGETATWLDLPAGINGRPIYYYVKETAYTINNVTYTLDETTGHYVDGSGNSGAYKPIYTGNAASGGDAAISVTNTKGLTIEKVWKNSDNTLMDPDQIPLTEVPVNLYGKTSAGTETLIGTFTITPDANNDWLLTVDDETYDLTPYTSFRVEEALDGNVLYGYAISYTYNTSGTTGSIVITNKDNTPTEVDVSVTKEWADGASGHDSITVNLWQTTVYQDDNGASLTTDNAVLYQNVELSESDSWTKTWEDLPYKSDTNQRYYYYPVEVVPDGYAASYTRTETSSKQSVTINNYVPGSLNLEKTWQNSSGTAISGSSALLPESIEIEIYRRLNVAVSSGSSTTKPASMNIVALGDSITQGTSGSGGPYTTKLDTLLESSTYGFTNITVRNCGVDGNAIMNMPDGTYYTTGETRQGLLNRLDSLWDHTTSTSVNLADADAVLILIGTNDMISNYTNYTKERLTDLLDGIYDRVDSDTIVFIASIPDFDFVDSSGNAITVNTWFDASKGFDRTGEYADLQTFEDYVNNTMVVNYNNVIKDLVANPKSTWTHLNFVDVNSAVDKDTQLDDGCHPNGTGYQNIANTFGAAINAYYNGTTTVAPPTDIDRVPEDLTSDELYDTVTIEPDESGNWKLSLDLPDKDEDGNEYIYYAKEKTTGTNYNPTYQNNGQILGDASKTIKISNTVDVAKTEIYVEKTWFDGKTTHPDITLTLQRSADGGTTWDTVTGASISWDTTVTPWRGTYSNLEMCDSDGNYFIYKVEETVPTGYIVTYGNPDGVQLSAEATADDRTLALTNTAIFSLNVQKIWADGTDTHNGDTVTIKIHRDIVDKTTGSGLMLALSTDSLKVQTGSDGIVTANSDTITAESNNTSVATVSVSGNTITIHGVAEGAATITVKNGSETATIVVTVSDAPVLLLEGETAAMTAGDTQQLTVKMSDDSTIPGTVTYSSSNTAAATVDASTGLVTALNQGKVTITATNGDGLTATYDIQVSLSDSFTLSASPATIYIGGESQITPSPIYGTFTYESLNPEIATVDANTGKITGQSAGLATIKATRNDGKTANVTITVQEVPLTVSPESVTLTVGQTQQLTVTPDTAKYESSDGNVATVSDSGLITAVAVGTATITVTSGSQTKEVSVNVVNGDIFENDNVVVQLAVGETVNVTSSTPMSNIHWHDGSIVQTSLSGDTITITGVAPGEVTIGVQGGQYNNLNAYFTVIVTEQQATTTTTSGEETTTTTTTTTTDGDNEETTTTNDSSAGGESTLTGTNVSLSTYNESNPLIKDVTLKKLELSFTYGQYRSSYIKCKTDDGTAITLLRPCFWTSEMTVEDVNGSIGMTYSITDTTLTIEFANGLDVSSLYFEVYNSYGIETMSYTITYASTEEAQSLSLRTTTSTLASSAKLARAASDEGIEVEFVDNVATITLMASDNWEKIIKNLPVCDADGNVYYYWIEEETVTGYAPTYKFEDGDSITADQDYCINAANPGSATATVKNTPTETSGTSMPSTGGEGTTWYYIVGMITMLAGAAGFIGLKRRQSSQR